MILYVKKARIRVPRRARTEWRRKFLPLPVLVDLVDGREVVLLRFVWRRWSVSNQGWVYSQGDRPKQRRLAAPEQSQVADGLI